MSNRTNARATAERGARLTKEDALALYEDNDLLALAAWARAAKERASGKNVYYTVNRHINLTNICSANCPLCAFQVEQGDARGYIMETDDVARVLETAKNTPRLTEIHIVSALHPDRPFSYYEGVVRQVRTALPHADIKAFTPVEIVNFAKTEGRSVHDILRTLQAAGLSSLPGGGAEILSDRVRGIICPNKATRAEWLDCMRTAHALGIRTNASMMYGHIETVEERIDHLLALRDLQDETGGFQTFIPFPFLPSNTELGQTVRQTSMWDDLRTIAISRLMLDNFRNIKAYWVMLTVPVAQIALGFGANDIDGTVHKETILHDAGAKSPRALSEDHIIRIIREIGRTPAACDSNFNIIETY